MSKCYFSHLDICGLRKGPGKVFMGSWEVLEMCWEPCSVHGTDQRVLKWQAYPNVQLPILPVPTEKNGKLFPCHIWSFQCLSPFNPQSLPLPEICYSVIGRLRNWHVDQCRVAIMKQSGDAMDKSVFPVSVTFCLIRNFVSECRSFTVLIDVRVL